MPRPAEGRFAQAEFEYDKATDSDRCPAGDILSRQSTQKKRGYAVDIPPKPVAVSNAHYANNAAPRKRPTDSFTAGNTQL